MTFQLISCILFFHAYNVIAKNAKNSFQTLVNPSMNRSGNQYARDYRPASGYSIFLRHLYVKH